MLKTIQKSSQPLCSLPKITLKISMYHSTQNHMSYIFSFWWTWFPWIFSNWRKGWKKKDIGFILVVTTIGSHGKMSLNLGEKQLLNFESHSVFKGVLICVLWSALLLSQHQTMHFRLIINFSLPIPVVDIFQKMLASLELLI